MTAQTALCRYIIRAIRETVHATDEIIGMALVAAETAPEANATLLTALQRGGNKNLKVETKGETK